MPQQLQTIPTSRPDRILAEFRPTSANLDTPAAEVDEDTWTDLDNFYMRNGFAQRAQGDSKFFSALGTDPLNLINVQQGTANFWVAMGDDAVMVTDQAGTVSDITPVIYGPSLVSENLNSTIINGFPIQSFGKDPPSFWDKVASNICLPLPGWPANRTVAAIRSFKFFLIAMNITDGSINFPDSLAWSDAAEPGAVPTEWDPLPSNQAGTTQLSATSGGIVDGLALRGQFVIYKNHSTYLCNFVGGTFVFSFRKLFTTSGILANNCVAEVEGQHVVMTDGDVILHDGQNLRSLVDRTMRRFIFLQIDADNFERSFVFNYRAAKECWICFPTTGNLHPNVAVVWDYAQNQLSVRQIPDLWSHAASGTVLASAPSLDWDTQIEQWDQASGNWNRAQFTGAFERVLAAAPATEQLLFVDDSNSLSDGVSPVGGTITRESLELGAPESFKYVRRIWPRIDGSTGTVVKIRVGGQTTPSGAISWSPVQDFEVNVDDFLNFDVAARYISVRFEEDTSPGAPVQALWQLHGFDVEYTLQGEF
jgi:hypothetical protein